MSELLLKVLDLQTHLLTDRGVRRPVDGVSLTVRRGETVALVGESGCGKSMTALSLVRLVPRPGRIVSGQVLFDGEDLLRKPEAEMRRIRGRRIGMVFQDPLSTLNPTLRVGHQIEESLRVHGIARGPAARQRSRDLLEAMGIPSARDRLRCYPHEMSGGMLQRVMIAIAVSCDPDLLIADEPTTALDVTLQVQIMDLLTRLKRERELAILLITHDLGLVSQFSDRVAVMYAGQIVEQGPTADLLQNPRHPYTQGLLRCVPRLGRPDLEILPIEGSVPDTAFPPPGCRFAPRCPEAWDRCETEIPAPRPVGENHTARCHLCTPSLNEEVVG